MARRGENIHKRKDNRWEARIIIDRDENKKPIYKSIYGKSYQEVRNNVKKYLELKKDSVNVVRSTALTIEDLSNFWLEDRKKRVKPSTYSNYYWKVQNHIIKHLGKLKLNYFTDDTLSHFETLLQEDSLSIKTRNDIFVLLNQILRYGIKKKVLCSSFEYLQTKCPVKKEIKILAKEETKTLVNSLQFDFRLKNIGILLCLYTGIRLGEVCALQFKDINFKDNTMYICKTMQRIKVANPTTKQKTQIIIDEPKSQNSKRLVPVPQFLMAYLIQNQPEKKNWKDCYILTGESNYIEPRSYQYYFEQKLEECKIEKVNFHSLRHTFATNAVESGMDIKMLSELLGHTDIKLTMQLYVHPTIENKSFYLEKIASNY